MILQALTEYYQRKINMGTPDIAPQGFEFRELPFIIVLSKEGNFSYLEDTRELQGKKKVGRKFLVPQSKVRSGKKSFEVSNDLWDHYGYVLGCPKEIEGTAKKTVEQIAKEEADNLIIAKNQHKSFIQHVDYIAQALPDDIGIAAVKSFLSKPEEIEKVKQSDVWKECRKIKGCNLSFRLQDSIRDLVCQSESVQRWVLQRQEKSDDAEQGICLVTGIKTNIARLHQPISGINAKPSPFASANLPAFESYYKTQGMVFPVGKQAMFEYTTALNTLLSSNNRFRIGDITAVCWGKKKTSLEEFLPKVFVSSKDNPDEHVGLVKALYKNLYNGQYVAPDGEEQFYVLGLSPNSARIVVRFWLDSTIAEISESLGQWFQDTCITRGESSFYPEYMPLMKLLCNLVLDGKAENLPQHLIADVIKSALNNQPLPISVLHAALRRNKAEQKITYGRACLMKAYFNRYVRRYEPTTQELAMNLDKDRTEIGYLLGRLFAVLEQIQSAAFQNKMLNSTIADRYLGAASTTPVSVFAILLKLSQHHLSKIKGVNLGSAIYFDKILTELISKINSFPLYLDINQQTLFWIGYYCQKQAFFTKAQDDQPTDEE